MSTLTRLGIGSVSAAVALSVSMMPAAQAVSLPSQGTFTNSAGQTNGCTGDVHFTTLNTAPNVSYAGTFACPLSADIHYGQYYGSLHVVNADGTWSTVQAQLRLSSWVLKSPAATEGSGAIGPFPCAATGQPTHTYVARYAIQLRSTKYQEDPFKLRTQAKFTC